MCICIKCGCFSCKSEEEKKKKEVDCADIILAILLPPAGIYKKEGCTGQFWVSVALTVFGIAPGSIHAAIYISRN